jgi:hypothetical protein
MTSLVGKITGGDGRSEEMIPLDVIRVELGAEPICPCISDPDYEECKGYDGPLWPLCEKYERNRLQERRALE